jgi:hypothetical protein
MLQTNHAIHLDRDPSLLLCDATLCGQVMASVGPSRYAADSRINHIVSPRATGRKAKDA